MRRGATTMQAAKTRSHKKKERLKRIVRQDDLCYFGDLNNDPGQRDDRMSAEARRILTEQS